MNPKLRIALAAIEPLELDGDRAAHATVPIWSDAGDQFEVGS
jgi:hypothetical protein